MTITTKFKLSDQVWFMKDNICTKGMIENIALTATQQLGLAPDIKTLYFIEDVGVLGDDHIFESKEALLQSL